MTFSPQFLDEIRARVALADVVGRRVRLQRKGREHVGLCPFHNERTPSFAVVEDKGFFHCFGCGAHGDVIGFVMRTENLSFPEAVAKLAQDAGLELPRQGPEEAARARRAASLYEVAEAACQWFQAQLKGPAGGVAREYLARRGVSADSVERFRLGWAPDQRTRLKEALTSKTVPEAALIESGLLVKPEDGGASYDRFRGRVIFPIADKAGRIIAFGGRILGDGKPKYLNSPETPLFQKGGVLYGLAAARVAARESGRILVVEGYMDVVALHQAGMANVVAPLGTALTERHLELLWRVAPEVVIGTDADSGGFHGAVRAYERALPLLSPDRNLGFALWPPGEDPDSLVRKQGIEALRRLLDASRPWFDLAWDIHLVGLCGRPDPRPEAVPPHLRAKLEADLEALVQRVGHEGLRRHLRGHVRERLTALFQPARARGSLARRPFAPDRAVPPPPGPPPPNPLGARREGVAERRERELVAAVVNHPGLVERIDEELAGLRLRTPRLDDMCRKILEVAAAAPGLDSPALQRHLRECGFSDVLDALFAPRPWSERVSLGSYVRPDASLAEAERGWRATFELHQGALLAEEEAAARQSMAENPTPESWEVHKALIALNLARKPAVGGEGGQA